MQTTLLIDALVRQTTVLIAHLSTAAGIRAPLSHVADEVFLRLASEIEAQGVGRKVVAEVSGANASHDANYIQVAGSIEVDGNYLCGLHDDGVVNCWGNDSHGQVSGADELANQPR